MKKEFKEQIDTFIDKIIIPTLKENFLLHYSKDEDEMKMEKIEVINYLKDRISSFKAIDII